MIKRTVYEFDLAVNTEEQKIDLMAMASFLEHWLGDDAHVKMQMNKNGSATLSFEFVDVP